MKDFNKVFGIGMSKTGTTTLGQCFELLGLVPHIGFVRDYKQIVKQNGDRKKILEAAENFRSFEDSPWYLMYEDLDKRFPGSRFILTVRKDSLTQAKSSWAHGVARGLRRGSLTQEYVDQKTRDYEAHNKAVLEYFNDRPDDLLVICWEKNDSWEKLCEFLGVELLDVLVPHANTGSYRNVSRPWGAIQSSYPYMQLLKTKYYLSQRQRGWKTLLRWFGVINRAETSPSRLFRKRPRA